MMKLRIALLTGLGLILLLNLFLFSAHPISAGYSSVRCADYAPNGKTFLLCRQEGNLEIHDARTGELIQTLTSQNGSIVNASYAPDAKTVALGTQWGAVELISVDGKQHDILTKKAGNDYDSAVVAFSPNGKLLLSGTYRSGEATLWDVTTKQSKFSLAIEDGIRQVMFAPDNKTAAIRHNLQKMEIWDTTTGNIVRHFEDITGTQNWAGYTANSRWLLVDRSDIDLQKCVVTVYNVREDKPLHHLTSTSDNGYPLCYESLAISANNIVAATSITAIDLTIWQLSTGKVIRTVDAHEGSISTIKFSPNGSLLLTSSGGVVKLWNVASGKLMQTLTSGDPKMDAAQPMFAAFSPGGLTLLTAGLYDEAHMWDVRTGKHLFKVH